MGFLVGLLLGIVYRICFDWVKETDKPSLLALIGVIIFITTLIAFKCVN